MADHEEEHGGTVLEWLDGPRLVVGAFAFFVLALAAFGVLLWSDAQKQAERVDAVVELRLKEERAAKREQVDSCFGRAAQGPSLQRVLIAIEREIDDPRGREQIRDFRRLSELNTPTIRECRQLARRLNVSIPREIR